MGNIENGNRTNHNNRSKFSFCDQDMVQPSLLSPNLNSSPIPNDSIVGSPNDKFFIKYVQNNNRQLNPNKVQTVMDQRRIVFMSALGLCATWRNVPPDALYTALCLMPLKREWITQPTKYYKELQQTFISRVVQNSDIEHAHQFIELMQWKESQGLVLWIFDYLNSDGSSNDNKKRDSFHSNPYVAPFWCAFNDKITSLYDHVTGSNYKPIHVDEDWWGNKDKWVSKYNVKPQHILQELYCFTRKHQQNAIKEIIYQSNPKSLHPMISYTNEAHNKLKPQVIVRRNRRVKLKGALSPLSPIKELGSARAVGIRYNYAHCVAQGVNMKNATKDAIDQKDSDHVD